MARNVQERTCGRVFFDRMYHFRRLAGFAGDVISFPTAISSMLPVLNGKYFGLSPWALLGGGVLSILTSVSTLSVENHLFTGVRKTASHQNNTMLNRTIACCYFLDEMGEVLSLATLLITLAYPVANDKDTFDLKEALLYIGAITLSAVATGKALFTAKDALGMTSLTPSFFCCKKGGESRTRAGYRSIHNRQNV